MPRNHAEAPGIWLVTWRTGSGRPVLPTTTPWPLTAILHGRRRELTNASLATMLIRYPLMPMRVVWLIHWRALRLWLKRVSCHRKPAFIPGQGSVTQRSVKKCRARG